MILLTFSHIIKQKIYKSEQFWNKIKTKLKNLNLKAAEFDIITSKKI